MTALIKNVALGLLLGVTVGISLDEYFSGNGRLLTATVGGSIALIIAFYVYPWQKSKERENSRQELRLALYREVIECSFIVFSSLVDSAEQCRKGKAKFDNQSAKFRELQAKYDALATCSRYTQLSAMDKYIDAISGYRTLLRVEFEELKYTKKYAHLKSDRQAHAVATQARNAAIHACLQEAVTNVYRATSKEMNDLANLSYPISLEFEDEEEATS